MGHILNESEQYFFAKNTGKKPFTLNDDRSRTCESEAVFHRRVDLLVELGLIRRASADEVAGEIFTVDQLKAKLKALGLRVGGIKAELIERIKSSDQGFSVEMASLKYWMLTPAGMSLRSEIWQDIRSGEGAMTIEVLSLLSARQYAEAHTLLYEFVKNNFTSMNCIDRESFDEYVKTMDSLPDVERENAIFSIMGGRPYYSSAAMSAIRKAQYNSFLSRARKTPSVIGVQIQPPHDDSCNKAKKYSGCYRIDEAPSFPFGKCEYDGDCGCRCQWSEIYQHQTVDAWVTNARKKNESNPQEMGQNQTILGVRKKQELQLQPSRPLGAPFSVDGSAQAEKKPGGLLAWLKSLF